MIIEETTTYAYKLKYIENVSFNRIRAFAQSFVNELPQELVDDIFFQLNHGLDLLQNEPQMLVYLHSYGKMHEAKLNRAFEQLPDAFLQQPEIRIIDYGCGQAIGTMCYADYLAEHGLSQNIISVTLIEPSEICLKRAALHISQFFPDAEIHTICKTFNDLTDNDLANPDDIPTLHILSNVLDIQEFDLKDFATLIANNLSNYNQFVCVGPYFNYSDKDERMTRFAELLNGNITYSKIFEKGELCDGKTWTAQIVCLGVGELEEEELSTEVTEEEIRNGIEDEFGAIYSRDGKRLLKCYEPFVENYKIKEGTKVICDGAFEDCYIESDGFVCHNRIRNISIPDSVIMIGHWAFATCFDLEKLTLPKSLEKLGGGLVSGNKKVCIESRSNRFIIQDKMIIDCTMQQLIHYFGNENCFEIPNFVTSIGNNAFYLCTFQTIIIPNTITSIGNGAFSYCNYLQQITIPDSVISIGKGAFSSCESLQHITIPYSVTSIGENAFICCDSLYHITVPKGREETFKKILPQDLWDKLYLSTEVTDEDIKFGIEDEFGVVYSKEGKRLLKCKNENIDNYTIKDGTIVICDNAFSFCKTMRQITLPDSLIEIGKGVFRYCYSLQQITLPDSVIRIGSNAFQCCKILQQINIPNSVSKIEDGIFEHCDSLQKIEIPSSTTHIGNGAFWMCKSLSIIIIPSSVTSIGDGAFYCCKSLRQITIPNSVTHIGDNPFSWCSHIRLKSESYRFVMYDEMLIDNQEKRLIAYLGHKPSLCIPNSIKIIGTESFNNHKLLRHITIPNSVINIGKGAFQGCKLLEQITIPKSVEIIGSEAFRFCKSLQHITFHNSITKIGEGTFEFCESLQYIFIPDSVVDIDSWAFNGCKSLQHIVISKSISNIGNEAFKDCSLLQLISLPNSNIKVEYNAFKGCNSIRIIIPESSTEKAKDTMPKVLWRKLYYLKTAIDDSEIIEKNETNIDVDFNDDENDGFDDDENEMSFEEQD